MTDRLSIERELARDVRRRAFLPAYLPEIAETQPKPVVVDIPADWLDLKPERIVNLARRLGASGKCNYTQAVAWVEKTISERAEQAAQQQGAA